MTQDGQSEAGTEQVQDSTQEAPETAAEGAGVPDVQLLQGQLEQAQGEAQANWDKYLRTAAEMQNLRKRGQEDLEKARKFAVEKFAAAMLDVHDSLEMGLSAAAESASLEALTEGSEATLRQLGQVFEVFGLEVIDPIGQPFDPNLHEAMTMLVSPEVTAEQVQTVVQKGYTLNGRLLRPARVIVAKPDPGAAG